MARIRTIKPEFFTSEDIVDLSPFARLLYIAIWCEADRAGRFTHKPKTFKLRYFPADDIQVEQLCDELIKKGLIVLYGEGFGHIPTFLDHQHINPRESESVLPEPDNSISTRRHASRRVMDAQGGREGKEGKEHASPHDASFAKFWTTYPKKKSRADAEKAWAKLKPNEHLADEILQAVQRAKTSADWLKEAGQFIPHPATWLNGKRWLDGDLSGSAKPVKDWE